MKVKQFKHPSNIFSATYLFEACMKIWRFFLNFDQIMVIEKLKKALDFLITLNYLYIHIYIYQFGYIYI